MGLTQISTAGVKDDAVTSGKIPANAVGTSEIADDAVTADKLANSINTSISNKLPLAGGTLTGNLTLSSTHPKLSFTDTNHNSDFQIMNNHGNLLIYDTTNATSPFNIDSSGNIQVSGTVDGVDIAALNTTVSNITTDVVSDTSPQLGGTLDTNNQLISFGDSSGSTVNRLNFGAGNDLNIYHDGNNSNLRDSGTGALILWGSEVRAINAGGSEYLFRAFDGGAFEAYYDNLKQIETFHASSVGHSPSGGSDITGGGVKTTRTNSTNSNIGYYCYKDSNLVARLTNHGSGPEGILQLYNQGVPKLTMNGTNGTIKLHGNAGYIQFGDTDSASHRFDDYEEGTWTPDWRGSNALGTTSYGTHNSASYVKIGNQVTIRGFSQITGSSGGSGFWFINNMPFTVGGGNDTRYRSVGSVFLEDFNFSSEDVDIICFAERNNNDMQLRTNRDSLGGGTSISVNNDTNFSVMWTITYPTA